MALAPVSYMLAARSGDELVPLIALGDRGAFEEFYNRTVSRAHGLVQRILVDFSQSEEVTQEVFLAVWQEAAQFDASKGTALAWLLTRARRRAIDRVRASQSSRDRDLASGLRQFEGSRDDVAETAEVRIEHRRVTDAMARLSPIQKEALELTYFSGLTQVEIAARLDIPVGTVKTRVRDALTGLRRVVG